MTTTSQNQNGSLQGGAVPPEQVRTLIEEAQKHYHVIGAMTFGEVPVGHSVVRNFLKANTDPKAGDVYPIDGGKLGLTGTFLNALADAAGVSTVGSKLLTYQANYCVVETTVARMGLDGTVRRVAMRKVMDLREGSGQLKAMRDAAKAKGKDAEGEVRGQRLRIAEHADSKAALRAIRAILSVRSYTPDELKKPFAIFKLQFTGRTNDPHLREIFAVGLMQASLGAMGMLYGTAPAALPGAPMLGGGAAPPMLGVGSAGAPMFDAGDGVPDEDDIPAGGAPSAAGGASGAGPAAGEPTRARAGDSRRVRLPGKSGKMIADAEEKDLLYWEKRVRGDFLGGKWEGDQYAERNMMQLLTMREELRVRKLAVEPCPQLDGAAPAAGAAAPAGAPTQDRPSTPRRAAPARTPTTRSGGTTTRATTADEREASDARPRCARRSLPETGHED